MQAKVQDARQTLSFLCCRGWVQLAKVSMTPSALPPNLELEQTRLAPQSRAAGRSA